MRAWTQATRPTLLGVTAGFSAIEVDESLMALRKLQPEPPTETSTLGRECARLIGAVHDAQRLSEAPDPVFAESLGALLREIDASAQPCAANGMAPPGLTKLRGSWQGLLASQGL